VIGQRYAWGVPTDLEEAVYCIKLIDEENPESPNYTPRFELAKL
jgi:hypothetical protein